MYLLIERHSEFSKPKANLKVIQLGTMHYNINVLYCAGVQCYRIPQCQRCEQCEPQYRWVLQTYHFLWGRQRKQVRHNSAHSKARIAAIKLESFLQQCWLNTDNNTTMDYCWEHLGRNMLHIFGWLIFMANTLSSASD